MSAVPAFGEWQPFETCPIGQRVLMYFPRENQGGAIRLVVALWERPGFVETHVLNYFGESFDTKPTHWMALPEPPQ
ncbi:MAG: DUF551 domain-containing protein [Litorimonas sp.]